MGLSKSKYCMGLQCEKYLWLNENKPNEKSDTNNESVLETGTKVGILARSLFGEYTNIEFGNLNKMISDTTNLLGTVDVITEASFLYENLFCSVDILRKNNNTYEIYEVKSSTEIKDIYIDDASYQYYVLNNLNIPVSKVCIVYINNKYVRHGDLELNKLFNVQDITSDVLKKQIEVQTNINRFNEVLNNDEPKLDISLNCTKPYDCPFFEYCTKHLSNENVFNIRRMTNKKKFDLYNEGYITYEDLLKTDIDEKFIEQIEFELYDKSDKCNKEEIQKFLNILSYPLYFLDFETFQEAIPEYDGISPFMQIPFQYSLHYIKEENGILEHKEFLAEDSIDPRRTLAESLVKDIPMNVTTIAYNMMFEKMVIKNLAKLFPDLSEHLMNIHDNMKDLMIPFKDRHYYSKEMYGSYSIKYVLPALFPNDESLNYHNLEMIHNGSEAMNSFANMGNLNKEEKEILRKNLLKYCELDTYAMVKIWDYLVKLCK